MQIELNGKQLSKLIELENQFAYLHKDEAAYALDKLLSCVNLISGVHIIDYALRYHDKNSLLGYEYIFDDDFKELVKNTWSDLRDKSAIDSLWSLHKDNSIVLLLDGEGRGVQIQLVDSAPTHFLTSLDGTHSVDEIESLLETFEQNVYFYDPEQETVVGKIY